MSKFLFKILPVIFLSLVFVFLVINLFFKEIAENLLEEVENSMFSKDVEVVSFQDEITVVFPTLVENFDPTHINFSSKQRFINTYQSLVFIDQNLNYEPLLANYWGLLEDNLTWEFALRSNVTFHDGSSFEANDVLKSFERALNYEDSELKDLLNTIQDIEVISPELIRITTKKPDPLFIQKISNLQIIPSEQSSTEVIDKYIGTGPYKLNVLENNDLEFTKFDQYWGDSPLYEKVIAKSVPDVSERLNLFFNASADVLTFVPVDVYSVIQARGHNLVSIPSLEVQMVLFNFKSKFNSKNLRELVSSIIDQEEIIELIGGAAKPVNQFVSTGVFGFNPDLEKHKYSIDRAIELKAEVGVVSPIIVDLPEGLQVLGDYLAAQFEELALQYEINYLPIDQLLESISNASSDLYFIAYKSDLADAQSFFQAVVGSDGQFNIGNFQNEEVDSLLQVASQELNPNKRLDALQSIMKILVEDEVIGVPFFEYETVYAFKEFFNYQPRVDALLYFDDIKQVR